MMSSVIPVKSRRDMKSMRTTNDGAICKNVKSLIRAIRRCKTAAEERELIARETAEIRSSLQKPGKGRKRIKLISKLLCIQLLTASQGGISVAFGQIDALRLLASHRFADKRLGNLAISSLLDSSQETLVLSINAFKSDLGGHTSSPPGQSHSMYVTGQALVTLSAILTPPMAQELAPEIFRLLSLPNAFLRKKAIFTLLRIIRISPEPKELIVQTLDAIKPLLTDRNHGVLLALSALVSEMAQKILALEQVALKKSKVFTELQNLAPFFVRALSDLLFSSSFPEYDVNGITDPFLQVSLLRLLRILGGDPSPDVREALNYIISVSEKPSPTSSAVRYECIQTMLSLDNNDGLAEKAIEALCTCFLSACDTEQHSNNSRSVALNLLVKSFTHRSVPDSITPIVVQSIESCLSDSDLAIVAKAIDVAFVIFADRPNDSIKMIEFILEKTTLIVAGMQYDSPLGLQQIPMRLLATLEKGASIVDPYRLVEMIFKITDLVPISLERGGAISQRSIELVSRVLAFQNLELQRYAVHVAATSLRDAGSISSCRLLVLAFLVGEYGHLLDVRKISPASIIEALSGLAHRFHAQCVVQYNKQPSKPSLLLGFYIWIALSKCISRIDAVEKINVSDLQDQQIDVDLSEFQHQLVSILAVDNQEGFLEDIFDVIPCRAPLPVTANVYSAPMAIPSSWGPTSSIQNLLAELKFEPLSPTPSSPESPKTLKSIAADSTIVPSPSRKNNLFPCLLSVLGEWLIYEKVGLLIYCSIYGKDPLDSAAVVRISVETSSNSTSRYEGIALEVAMLKGIEATLEKASTDAISGNERLVQIIRVGQCEPSSLRIRFRINFNAVTADGERLATTEDVIDFHSPL